MSVNCMRQAIQFRLYSVIIVVILFNEFLLEMFHGTEILQIQRFTAEGGGLPLGVAICLKVWYK